MNYITLNNGVKMPQLGYGVYQVSQEECERCVLDALQVGYRSIDTAQSYFNEEQVGTAIEKSRVDRKDIFLTTKVWVEHYGYKEAKASVLESLRKLRTDYLDLCLLHQPFADYYGAWHALEELYEAGKIRAIGVSNFYPDRLVDLCSFARIKPMVNQVEVHPLHQQGKAKEWMEKYGVQMEAWAPFGEGRSQMFTNPVLAEIGAKYGKTVAQVILRWHLQRGVVVIPNPPTGSGCRKIWKCSTLRCPLRTWKDRRTGYQNQCLLCSRRPCNGGMVRPDGGTAQNQPRCSQGEKEPVNAF